MADLQKPIRQMEQRLGDVSREILRIEAHLRRGELRAAGARIDGVRQQLMSLSGESDTAMQMTLVGAQLGLLSGGNWLRGRVPAAILCGIGGWMYGQSLLSGQRREVQHLAMHVEYLDEQLQEAANKSSKSSTSSAPSES